MERNEQYIEQGIMVTFCVNVITEDNNNNNYYCMPTINLSKRNQKWVINKQGMRKERKCS